MLMVTRPPRGSGDDKPWIGEPNLVQWRDRFTGYQCLILRNMLGILCGYVRVPRDHALHGRSYTRRAIYRAIEVHGGLTFSGCLGGRRMKRGHWFGFDCGHFGDAVPVLMMLVQQQLPEHLASLFRSSEVYRSVEYVRAECTSLAQQLSRKGKQ